MNSTDFKIEQLQLLYGKPINCHDICLVYQFTIGQIIQIGLQNFYKYIYMLTIDPSSMVKSQQQISTFDFLLLQSIMVPQSIMIIQEAFKAVIHQDVSIIADMQIIQVGQLSQGRMFTRQTYQDFMKILKKMYRLPQRNNDGYNTQGDSLAQKIRNKLNRGRQAIKEIKAKQGSDDEVDLCAMISSLGLYYQNIQIVWKLPYYTFFDQVTRMQLKETYDNNILFSLVGAKIPKDKMKYWICKVQDSKGG